MMHMEKSEDARNALYEFGVSRMFKTMMMPVFVVCDSDGSATG